MRHGDIYWVRQNPATQPQLARAVVGKALRLFEFFGSEVCSLASEVEILAGPLELPPLPEEKSLAAEPHF